MSRVLIVEDDAWLADCMAEWLKAGQHSVHCVSDAQAALDMLDNFLPDVVVLDLFLPVANGLQVLHQLSSYNDVGYIPVILCSNALPTPMPDMSHYGVRAALDKTTLTPQTLRRAVVQALHHATV